MPPDFKKKLERIKERAIIAAVASFGFASSRFFNRQLVFSRFKVRKNFIAREIAEDFEILSEWKEITLRPAIEAKKARQLIYIFIEGYRTNLLDYVNEPDKFSQIDVSKVILPDGTILKPQVQLVDEAGEIHDLKFSWRPYAAGFSKELPKGRRYVRLRLCSDKPFKSYRISWLDTDD